MYDLPSVVPASDFHLAMIISQHSAQGGHLTDILVKLLLLLPVLMYCLMLLLRTLTNISISSDTGIIGSKANI